MDSIIKAENLTFYYSDEPDAVSGKIIAAVNGISVDIRRGSFTAIIGHNGSGKSTLAKLLSGIYEPASGSVTVTRKDGVCLDCKKEEHNLDIRKTVGMVFQNPDNQLVASIVEDDVAFAPENLGFESSEIRKRVDDCLSAVGLSEYAGHNTHKLSGGQKQRVAIAGILAMNPECIIFDESTAMLDPKGRRDILDVILSLKDRGVTTVLITHYMNEAAMADNVIVVHEGKKVCEGTPCEVFSQAELLDKCSLEAPQSTSLWRTVCKNSGENENSCVINTDEAVKAITDLLDKKGVKPHVEG